MITGTYIGKLISQQDKGFIEKVYKNVFFTNLRKGNLTFAEGIILKASERNVNDQEMFYNYYCKLNATLRESNLSHQEEHLSKAIKIYPNEPFALFDNIDLMITLRCNMNCLNCIELCNMREFTGLELEDKDMTMKQIKRFIKDVKSLKSNHLQVSKFLHITGGEPLLHPKVLEITEIIDKELISPGFIGYLYINSNLIIEPPLKLKKYIVNFSKVEDKQMIHNTVLIHPLDFGNIRPSFKTCNHYRKWTVVCNYFGYNLCCAGDAYIRLFGLEDLIIERLPSSYSDFPLDIMDIVCQHCPFGICDLPFEKDFGRQISKCYTDQATMNKLGRKINKKLTEI